MADLFERNKILIQRSSFTAILQQLSISREIARSPELITYIPHDNKQMFLK